VRQPHEDLLVEEQTLQEKRAGREALVSRSAVSTDKALTGPR